ncbi:MAG: hypothetical protein AABY84_13075 [Candidatus Firestonebacteria bacterium]
MINTTIVGIGEFSCEFLNDIIKDNSDYNYLIVDNDADKLSRYSNINDNDKLFIYQNIECENYIKKITKRIL